jgi:type I restriction enzyme S subunit
LIELLQEKRTALITHAVTKGLDPNVPMKDSGIEWLGQIPAHWDVKKATWLCAIGSGTTPNSENPNYYGDGTPWLTTSELREVVVNHTQKHVTKKALDDYRSLKVHEVGSVVVAMYGATIGRVGLLGVAATVNQACCVFSPLSEITSPFEFYWFQMAKPHLVSLGTGGGQPNLSQELLRSIRISIPALDEQQEITDFLGRKTAKIDALIAKIEAAIERLKEYRTALISAAVTGKIDVRGEAISVAIQDA